eukprot:3245833-Amphidinium_carterae.1
MWCPGCRTKPLARGQSSSWSQPDRLAREQLQVGIHTICCKDDAEYFCATGHPSLGSKARGAARSKASHH